MYDGGQHTVQAIAGMSVSLLSGGRRAAHPRVGAPTAGPGRAMEAFVARGPTGQVRPPSSR